MLFLVVSPGPSAGLTVVIFGDGVMVTWLGLFIKIQMSYKYTTLCLFIMNYNGYESMSNNNNPTKWMSHKVVLNYSK